MGPAPMNRRASDQPKAAVKGRPSPVASDQIIIEAWGKCLPVQHALYRLTDVWAPLPPTAISRSASVNSRKVSIWSIDVARSTCFAWSRVIGCLTRLEWMIRGVAGAAMRLRDGGHRSALVPDLPV